MRTGPAGIPVRGCVGVRADTRGAREPRAYRSCARRPSACPALLLVLPLTTVSDSLQKNCPQLSNRPHKLGLVFRSPRTVCGGLMSNTSATRGHPDMRLCVCGSPRGDLSHIASLTLGAKALNPLYPLSTLLSHTGTKAIACKIRRRFISVRRN